MIHIPDNILPRNSEGKAICPKCQNLVDTCTCPSYKPAEPKEKPFTPIIQLDKKGRKGKVVTLIKDLPANEAYLKTLAKQLKSETGSGGTFYVENGIGIIEIQGNHTSKITSLISNENKN